MHYFTVLVLPSLPFLVPSFLVQQAGRLLLLVILSFFPLCASSFFSREWVLVFLVVQQKETSSLLPRCHSHGGGRSLLASLLRHVDAAFFVFSHLSSQESFRAVAVVLLRFVLRGSSFGFVLA